jgi:hypothetical protein
MLIYNSAADKAAYLLYFQNWIPLWHSLKSPSIPSRTFLESGGGRAVLSRLAMDGLEIAA